MNSNETNIIVALIPQDSSWTKVETPHMTLVSIGNVEDLKVNRFNELAKDVASIAMLSNPIMAKVMGKDVMGTDQRVDVLLIDPSPEILSIHRMLRDWDNGDFPSFEPHVTVGPEGSWNQNWDMSTNGMPMPMYITFDRIMILWGSEKLPFWLKKY